MIFIVLTLCFNIVSATNFYDVNSMCKIQRQDHLQQFIDYDCKFINSTTFELSYKVNNIEAFETLDNLSKKETKFLEKDKETENFISSTGLKYDAKEVKEEIKQLKSNGFPMYTTNDKIKVDKVINPYNENEGKVKITLPKSIFYINSEYIEIGFGTLLLQFSNGLTNETLNISFAPGYLDNNLTRYFKIEKFSLLTEATMNIAAKPYYYGVYDEYEYFDGPFDPGKIDYYSYIDNPPAGGTSTYTQTSSKFYAFTYIGSAAGSYYRIQKFTLSGYDNLKQNVSLLIDYYLRSYTFAGGNSNGEIRLTDGTNTVDIVSTSSVTGCSGYDEEVKSGLYKLNINTSTMNLTVYNENNTYVSTINLSTLTGSIWNIQFYEWSQAGCNGGGGIEMYIYDIGINDNETEYSTFTTNGTNETYPTGIIVTVGDSTVYTNTSEFNTSTTLDIESAITNSVNLGSCDCTDCIIDGSYCYVPFTVYSNTGGAINYSSISINYTEFAFNLTLIDERTAEPLDINLITGAKLYYSNVSVFDFKNSSTNTTTLSLADNQKFYVELTYPNNIIVTRWIDTSFIENASIRVCANPDNTTHYEQILYGNTQRGIKVKNVFANCIVGYDENRFAYETAKALKVYTIETAYQFLLENSTDNFIPLADIDGSIASLINIDNLLASNTQYNLDVNTETLTFSIYNDTAREMVIQYYNGRRDNTATAITIINVDDSSTVYSRSTFTDLNNITIYFNYSSLAYDNNTVFKITVDTTKTSGLTKSISRYFNTQLRTGILPSAVAFTMSLMIIFIGITTTLVRTALGWFGFMSTLIAIAIASLGIMSASLLFLMGLETIAMIYILIIMIFQTYPTTGGVS